MDDLLSDPETAAFFRDTFPRGTCLYIVGGTVEGTPFIERVPEPASDAGRDATVARVTERVRRIRRNGGSCDMHRQRLNAAGLWESFEFIPVDA